MNKTIEEVFENIPAEEILGIAKNIFEKLRSGQQDTTLVRQKENREYVTKADILIQECLLEYFANSPLAESYTIKAEEEISDRHKLSGSALVDEKKQWQLIIDPLDGTDAFCRGEETWGAMVGLCNRDGNIIYSWNMISTGEIFSSKNARAGRNIFEHKKTDKEKLNLRDFLAVDVYDYGAGAVDSFKEVFERISLKNSNHKYNKNQIIVSSSRSSVWAGWQLFTGEIDCALWLASSQGKRNFPDYDLIFIGALRELGFEIALGEDDDNVVKMLVIAGDCGNLELLWEVGLEILQVSPLDKKMVSDRDI